MPKTLKWIGRVTWQGAPYEIQYGKTQMVFGKGEKAVPVLSKIPEVVTAYGDLLTNIETPTPVYCKTNEFDIAFFMYFRIGLVPTVLYVIICDESEADFLYTTLSIEYPPIIGSLN